MKITELYEDGVIVPGVNTTPDVKPGETERQAKKFFGGNGKPKPLGVKGATPNQAFNLGLAENMSVTGTERRRLEKKKGIKIGTPEWFKHWFDLPYLREDITRDELMARLKDQQRVRYIKAMLDAMHKLVQSKGTKHSLGSYAFEIGKVFGFDSRELEKMYRDMYMSEVNEAFDNPYPYTWDSTQDRYAEFGNDSFLAKAEMDMGELLVMFTLGKPGVSWTIDFAVDGAMDKTGDGDQFRIFATVVAVIKDWMANKVDLSKVTQIDFSSDKDGAAEDSRSKLYKRFGQQLASKLGWNLEVTDRGQFASFKIKNPNAPVEEAVNEATEMKISDLTISDAGMAIAQSVGGGSRTDAPLAVTKLPSGHVYLVNGYHRLVDAMQAGKDTVSVEYVPYEKVEILWKQEREQDIKYGKQFNEDVTQPQLNALEKAVDKVFGQVGIDVEFTRHFLDRANDARNGEPISIKELAMLFKKEYQRWGKPIAQMGPNAQAVLKDLESDINVPFVLQWDRENNELDMIAKTVMRKKDFRTSNKEFPVEALTNNVMQRAQQQLSEKSKIDPKLIEKIIAKALELGIDPNILLAIAYKESRIRTGLTGDKNKKDFAHGIFQVRKPAMQDVNRYYKTNYSVDDMKNDVDANIDAGARYYKMMYDAYGAKDLESALAGYNGGPKAARTGKNKQANNYARSVNNISKDIQSVITVPQPKKVTPSKNEPYRDDSTDPESWDEPEYPMVDPKAVDRAVKQAIAYEPPKTATKQPEIITTVLPPAPTEPSLAPATSPRPKLRPTKTTYQDLAKSNNISNPDLIKVGQKIDMPDGTTHTVRSGDTLSDIAKKHNRRSLESKVEEVFDVALENFADGKKKGKSRPGRVKRAGASCNGSVTELRKKAKNSSGERAKMYHWCANMKSGRKKSK